MPLSFARMHYKLVSPGNDRKDLANQDRWSSTDDFLGPSIENKHIINSNETYTQSVNPCKTIPISIKISLSQNMCAFVKPSIFHKPIFEALRVGERRANVKYYTGGVVGDQLDGI